MFGILKSGAAYLPVDPGYPKDRVEYMLSEKEQDQLITLLNDDEKELKRLQQGLLKASSQGVQIENYLRPKFERVVKRRGIISGEEEHNLYENMNNIILNGGLAYGV